MRKPILNTKQLEAKMIIKGFKTRKSFAQAVGVSEHSISNLLNGVYNPSYLLMNKIFEVLDLTADEGMAIFFSNYLRNKKVYEDFNHEPTA
ncbi:helix-turn-helix transcriptional regulator [Bacillus thuringiensis]|uniref:helix-turn-helix transcriptional regulator n=2 Tax=Bacillus thuringiensis TaxID=1428 RepID=UPI001E38B963|nr:helix-turn-helix transcriptional regulator [Bacillus thuringiensis]MED2125985.1 helix-turn-helix transcriptional regulator [Bacillus thuringiensis]MED2170818.1 helix-turn-helix transcriptional regulator [Bacillus thuringiensis]MED2475895.1 helix-turn-helix transcriptional regulator [Bacillus thuringiensis]MED2577229.1 helix-turn-helix transcriptional regulator [Bacillus thuringiensis]MED2649248.1 helix-turn-helix transcriptional regulator [Bacillus thuringiensis]